MKPIREAGLGLTSFGAARLLDEVRISRSHHEKLVSRFLEFLDAEQIRGDARTVALGNCEVFRDPELTPRREKPVHQAIALAVAMILLWVFAFAEPDPSPGANQRAFQECGLPPAAKLIDINLF